MIIYRNLINAILTQKKLHKAAKELKPDYFNGQGELRLVYEYILKYYREYSEVPEAQVVTSKFKDFEYEERYGEIKEYIDVIHRDIYYRDYMEVVKKMIGFGKGIQDNRMSIKEAHRMSSTFLNDLSKMISTESSIIDISKNSKDFMREYHEKQSKLGGGVPTFIPEFDNKNVILSPGNLIYVFARPGAGKTWSIIYMAKEMWKNKYRVLILSYEMSVQEVDERAVCIEACVDYSKLVTGKLSPQEVLRVQNVKQEWEDSDHESFFVCDPTGEDVGQIENKIIETDADIVFVDYIHLIANDQKYPNTKEAVEAKSKALKQIARKLKIPIVVINHSNREFSRSVKDADKNTDQNLLPQLENISDADGCGKDADLVFGLHAIKKTRPDGSQYKEVIMGVVKGRFVEECQTTIDMDLRRGIFKPEVNYENRFYKKESEKVYNEDEEINKLDESGLGDGYSGNEDLDDDILSNRLKNDTTRKADSLDFEVDLSVLNELPEI